MANRFQTLLIYAFIQGISATLSLVLISPTHPVLRALFHSGCAALLARSIQAPWWWIALHGILPLLGWTFLSLSIPSSVYLIAFAMLALLFGSGSLRRAPLYLSGEAAWSCIAEHIPSQARVLDAGCGFAGILHYLYQHRPDLSLTGAELAWLPTLICRLRCRGTPIRILHHDFWHFDWAEYTVIFVFLSPDPMPAIWNKFQQETKPGTWLISYHFEVPDQSPNWMSSNEHGHFLYGYLHH